jgi:phenylalanyl-tRNA synthetase beta chain
VPIQNPLTADHTHLRTCLLPGLLDAVRVNVSRRRDAVHLFEIGRVFAQAEGAAPIERKALALAMRGRWLQGVWDDRGRGGEVSFFNLRGVLEALVAELRAGILEVAPFDPGPASGGTGAPPWLHPGRSGRVRVSGLSAGLIGELHPAVAERFDLPGRTCVAELDLDGLLDRAVLQPRFAGIPRHQAVRRDVAVVAPASLPNAAVEAALREVVGDLLESVELFDVYEGPPLDPGTRNLAYALSLRAPDRTLTGEEVEGLVGRVHTALPARLPVTIRT